MRSITIIQLVIVSLTLLIIYHELSAFIMLPKFIGLIEEVIVSIIPEGVILTPIFENYKLIFLMILAYASYKGLQKGKCSSLVIFAILLYSLTIVNYFRTLIGIQALSKNMKLLIENLLLLLSVNHNVMPPSINLAEGLTLITLYIIARETENLNKITNYLTKGNFPHDDINKVTTSYLSYLTLLLGASVGTLIGTLMLIFHLQSLKLITLLDIRVSLLTAIILIIVIGLTIYRIYRG